MEGLPMSYESFEALRPVITDAVEAALRAYFLGLNAREQALLAGPEQNLESRSYDPQVEWRQSNLSRYSEGTWKHSLIQVLPFRQFRPTEIVAEHGATLKEWHPSHNHITSAVANVLAWLLKDGVIAKVSTGVYVPAVNGVGLILPNDLGR
jgi:hypothetical protein